MPVNRQALFDAAVMLAEIEEMRVSVGNTVTSAAIAALAGTGAFLLMGPAGFFVGSTVAGLGACAYNKNKFKPVFVILKDDLRPQQQQELIKLLQEAFADVDYMDFVKFAALMMNKQEIWLKMRTIVMQYVVQYFMTELSVKDVKVDVKKMTESDRRELYREEFMRMNGLTGEWRPRAIKASSGSESAAAPGWRSGFVAGAADTMQRPAEAPALLQSAETSAHYDGYQEQIHPTSASRTTLKTTF